MAPGRPRKGFQDTLRPPEPPKPITAPRDPQGTPPSPSDGPDARALTSGLKKSDGNIRPNRSHEFPGTRYTLGPSLLPVPRAKFDKIAEGSLTRAFPATLQPLPSPVVGEA